MRDIMLLLAYCVILISCEVKSEEEKISNNDPVEAHAYNKTDISSKTNYSDSSGSLAPSQTNPGTDPIIEGKNLIQKANCLSCHKEQEKVIGPAYVEVAKKYKPTKENIEMLSNRIINGSTGVWGANQMTAHPDLTKEDAKKMVQYILSLK